MVALGDVASVISRSSYLFGVSWPDVRRTLLVAVEQDGDPYAVMIPTPEIIRFYYARGSLKPYFGGNTMRRSMPSGAASSKKA